MKKIFWLVFAIGLMISMLFLRMISGSETYHKNLNNKVQIYLYGEVHGRKVILEKEFETWKNHYDKDGIRHLFMEISYSAGELLNLWMRSDDDKILDQYYSDLEGSLTHIPEYKVFLKQIKEHCPETVFHGTDIGHNELMGSRYLSHLLLEGEEDSEKYRLAEANIQQGQFFNETKDNAYRENTMVENFIREYNKLEGQMIMGIYGADHIAPKEQDSTKSVPCMADQLKNYYGDIIYSEDISDLRQIFEPSKIEEIEIKGKTYEASYIGEYPAFSDEYRIFKIWRLENAYEDFKNNPKIGNYTPHDVYPIYIKIGEVFIFDFIKQDGTAERMYFRADGDKHDGKLVTVGFSVS